MNQRVLGVAKGSGRWLALLLSAWLLCVSQLAGAEPAPSSQPALASATPAAANPAPGESARAAWITLHGTELFKISLSRAGRSPSERAQNATRALDAGFASHASTDLHTETRPEGILLLLGDAPLILLTHEDARAAGDSNLDEYGAANLAQARRVFDQEKRRSNIAHGVFSFSLVVFLGLIAFTLMRKLSELGVRARNWLEENPGRVPALRLQRIELASPALLRTSLELGSVVLRRLGQVGVLYLWLVVSLSLFETTRGYTTRLTGVFISPLSGLLSRLATSLPLFVVALTALLAVALVVRFIGLFFESISRGESDVAWLPRDFARPVGLIVRGGLLLATLVFAAPIITGDSEGALARSGTVLLAALGLALVPLFATALVGAVVLFGRRLQLGELVETQAIRGRVTRLGLLDLDVETPERVRVRIPHLSTLTHPLQRFGLVWTTRIRLSLPRRLSLEETWERLSRVAEALEEEIDVELSSIDEGRFVFHLAFRALDPATQSDALRRLAAALDAADVVYQELGR